MVKSEDKADVVIKILWGILIATILVFGYLLNPAVPNSKKYIAEYKDKYYYQKLDANMQENYGDIYTAVIDRSDRDDIVSISGENPITGLGMDIPLSHSVRSDEDMLRLFTAFTYDNPQFFFVNPHYGMRGRELFDTVYYREITLLFDYDTAKRAEIMTEIEKNTADILQKAAAQPDMFERELLLHEWLVNRCTYQDDKSKYETVRSLSTIQGALTDGDVICGGYTAGMQYLLQKSGIPCASIQGKSLDAQDASHIWNMVTIDGEQYYLDVTWNDSGNHGRHNHFNITTEELLKTHEIFDTFPIETLTATAANYYCRRGLFVDPYSPDTVISKVTLQLQNGEDTLEFRCTREGYTAAHQLVKNGTAFRKAVGAKASGKTLWRYSIVYDDKLHTIALIKKK